jgi:uncharacterized protein YbcI
VSEEATPDREDAKEVSLTTSLARALGAAMKKFYGKGPVSSKAHFIEDDILVVVMREPTTTAEQSMAKAGREGDARDFRLAFEDEYAGEINKLVEELTGRKVATYHSQIVFDPDVLFEIFVFAT